MSLKLDDKAIAYSVISSQSSINMTVSREVWHQRPGHPSSKVFDIVAKTCNLPVIVNEKSTFCEACKFGKSHALPFPLSVSHASTPFELIHTVSPAL